MTSRRWVFTLNNYTAEELEHVRGFLRQCTYAIFGRERGANNTPHLQGFLIYPSPQRLSFFRRRLSERAHFERSLGSTEQASAYCKKDGDFEEFGERPPERGRRRDLEEFIAWGDEFIREHGRPPSSPEIARSRPFEYARYPRAVNLFAHRAPPVSIQTGEPRDWQLELVERLEQPADARTVVFYVDSEGGKGKTWFQQWYLSKYPERCQVLSIGKRDDLAYMIDALRSIFFFNVPRGGIEFLQYPILEQLKDRMVHSHKYNSRIKIFRSNVHVIVFSNEMPDLNKMSSDRFLIINMD